MRSSFFKDPIILQAEEIAETIASGTTSPEIVKPAILDALENGAHLDSGVNLAQSGMNINVAHDGTLKISYTTSEIIAPVKATKYWWSYDERGELTPVSVASKALSPEMAPAIHDMTFKLVDHGYELIEMERLEGWDQDVEPSDGSFHVNTMVVHTDIDVIDYEYAVNLKHVMQTRDRQLRAFTHELKTSRYTRHSAIAERIEAATCPEDIEDIRAEHTRPEMTDEVRKTIESMPELREAIERMDAVEKKFGHRAASNIICNASTAEEFQMAAAIYRRYFVHEHDRAGVPPEPFVSDDSRLSEAQKKRAHMFGIHYQQDSKGLVKEILKNCGEQMEIAALLACGGVNQQLCRQAELMSQEAQGKFKRARSDKGRRKAVGLSGTALSLVHDVLGNFNRLTESEGPISMMTMAGDGERGTAEALQAVLAKSNIMSGTYVGPVSKTLLDKVYGKLEA